MRKRNGFTLVEIITVLVLLALLMAVLLPSMTAYICRAREQSMIVRARAALLAAQTLLIERYGTEKWTGEAALTSLLRRAPGRPPGMITAKELLTLAELSQDGVTDIQIGWDEHATVTQFIWVEAAGSGNRSAVWDGISWSVQYEMTPG